jgi:hypothetical protein
MIFAKSNFNCIFVGLRTMEPPGLGIRLIIRDGTNKYVSRICGAVAVVPCMTSPSPRHKYGFFIFWNMLNIDDRLIKDVSPKIGPNALSVLLAISIHLDQKTGTCFPSHERLMELTGIGKNSVYDALKVLKDHGILQSIQDINSKNHRFSKRVLKVNTDFISVFVPASRLEPLPEIGEPFPKSREPEAGNRNLGKPNILTSGTNYISSTMGESDFSPLDTDYSTQNINGGGPAAAQLDGWLRKLDNPLTRESFTMVYRVPATHFDTYLKAFEIDIKGRSETYYSYTRLAAHFLNWCERRYRIESKPTPQPVSRFAQPEPAPAYKPPKPIENLPEPKYRSR